MVGAQRRGGGGRCVTGGETGSDVGGETVIFTGSGTWLLFVAFVVGGAVSDDISTVRRCVGSVLIGGWPWRTVKFVLVEEWVRFVDVIHESCRL